jgi:ABC-type antimicrobial peptide transport system permease subunit
MTRNRIIGYGLLGIVFLAVLFRGIFGLIMLLGMALAVLVVVSLAVSLISLAVAFLPIPKVPITYNFRNLQMRWKTTLVTGLAFTLVIFILTVMLAFVQGMYRLTQESGQPGNVMVLSDGANDEAFSNLPPGLSVYQLPRDLQEMIQKDEQGKHMAVMEVYVIANQELENANSGGRRRRFVQVRGVDNPLMAARIHGIELDKGTWFSKTGVREIDKESGGKESVLEVVLGDGVARTFGQDKGQGPIGPGEVIKLGPRRWYVVGVMKPSGSAFGSEVWAKDQFVAESFGRMKEGGMVYNTAVVRIKDPALAEAAAALLKKERSQDLAIVAFTEADYYSKLSSTNQQFLGAVIVIAIIMAFGGILGIMNTMFAAISQRSKDIGVLRLLGFSRWQILVSFLFESVLIAFVGGLIGCALGFLTDGWTATSIVSSGAGGGGKSVVLKLVVNGTIIGAGLGFAFLMGAVGGLVPSWFSMRLKPLESLR